MSAMTTKVKAEKIRAIKGMADQVPPSSARMQQVEACFQRVLRRFGFQEIRTPIVEYTHLFARSIGDNTDIVEKEMYTFPDRDGKLLTMRPEGTAGVVRAFVEHSLGNADPVNRLYYKGPMFRHERAQRGRYRQFHQLGVELLGPESPFADGEVIDLLYSMLSEVGVPDLKLHLNTLGCGVCRPGHREALIAFLKPKKDELCSDCQRRLESNPLRVLDCKNPKCQELAEGAPLMSEHLCSDCDVHWDAVRKTLDDREIPYELDPKLVRGLDYYNRTAFEIKSNAGELGAQNTLGGGGRYDGLVAQLGGNPTPAVGFAIGLERVLLAIPEEALTNEPLLDGFIVTTSAALTSQVLPLLSSLRQAGLSMAFDLRQGSMKSQMKRANKLGARYVLIFGESEAEKGSIILRNMSDSSQEEMALADVLGAMKGETQTLEN